MISKIPAWVWCAAWALAFMAGIINVVGLLSFKGQALTHLTGATSMLAIAAAKMDTALFLHVAAVIGSFVLGTAISGFVVEDSALQLGYRYGVALLLQAVLLVLAVSLLYQAQLTGLYAASCAAGLQNAMVSTFSGAVIRTSHVSGMFTDLGIFFGHWLRGIPVDGKRLRLCFIVITGFGLGGFAGATLFRFLSYATLYLPAGLAALASVAYGIYRWRGPREVA